MAYVPEKKPFSGTGTATDSDGEEEHGNGADSSQVSPMPETALAGSRWLELHEPLDDVPGEISDDIILRPLLDELGKCDTGLGNRGVPRAEVAVQKQPLPRATMAALYATRATPSYTTRGDTISPIEPQPIAATESAAVSSNVVQTLCN